MKFKFVIILIVAALLGAGIAWIDSGPGWDDTGITVFIVLLTAFFTAYFAGRKPWLIALASSIWIPLNGIIYAHNYSSLIALVPGFAGAFTGYLVRKYFSNA